MIVAGLAESPKILPPPTTHSQWHTHTHTHIMDTPDDYCQSHYYLMLAALGLCPFNNMTQCHTKYHLGNKGSFCWQNKKDRETEKQEEYLWCLAVLENKHFLGSQQHRITDHTCFFRYAFLPTFTMQNTLI